MKSTSTLLAASALAAGLALAAAPASAAIIYAGNFSGNECGGGVFLDCDEALEEGRHWIGE